MNRLSITVLATLVLTGCMNTPQRSIPVVDAGRPVSEEEGVGGGRAVAQAQAPAWTPARQAQQTAVPPTDSGVIVTFPDQDSGSGIEVLSESSGSFGSSAPSTSPAATGTVVAPVVPSAPSGIPSSTSSLNADEQLDGPVLALLTSARQQQSSGDLGGASVSLERAQRIAPREPQVLFRLAQVRLAQNEPAQAEQLARRALGYAGGRATLQAELWEVIAQARERQGDANGAAQARQRARVSG